MVDVSRRAVLTAMAGSALAGCTGGSPAPQASFTPAGSPDRRLWVVTSNTFRGTPVPTDDRVVILPDRA